MDRRHFIETCSSTVACLSAGVMAGAVALPAFADARPKEYAPALLTNEFGDPLKVSALKPQTNYVFHYPFVGTPAFLLDLGKSVGPARLQTRDRQPYRWPGGVGPRGSLVAFSAICAHQLVYPTKELSFIRFRSGPAQDPRSPSHGNDVIHCCADHSQYDPARGAQVLGGPAEQPLCTVLLEYDAAKDTLMATGTLGGELFNEFFRKYETKLGLEVGPTAWMPAVGGSPVYELDAFSRNAVRC